MSRRYSRPASPPSRRYVVAERASLEPVYSSATDSFSRNYHTPRTSNDRVVPFVTERWVNGVKISEDAYQNRPRRSTMADQDGPRSGTMLPPPLPSSRLPVPSTRSAGGRAVSPERRPRYDDRGYESTLPTRTNSRRENTKLYAVDGSTARLLEDTGRGGDRRGADRDWEIIKRAPSSEARARGLRQAANDGYEYTEPRRMYEETEPTWRSRRGSFDVDEYRAGIEESRPRSRLQSGVPPPATHGRGKIGEPYGQNSAYDDGQQGQLDRRSSLRIPSHDDYARDRRIAGQSRAVSPPQSHHRRQASYNEDDYRAPSRATGLTRGVKGNRENYDAERYDCDDGAAGARYRMKPTDSTTGNRGFVNRRESDEDFGRIHDDRDRRRVEPGIEGSRPSSARRDRTPDGHDDDALRPNIARRGASRLREPVRDSERRRSGDIDRLSSRDSRRDGDLRWEGDHDAVIDKRRNGNDAKKEHDYSKYQDETRRDLGGWSVRPSASREPSDDKRTSTGRAATLPAGGLAALGTAALGTHEATKRRQDVEKVDEDNNTRRATARDRTARASSPADDDVPRRRRYVRGHDVEDERDDKNDKKPAAPMDADEEYRRRIKLEAERTRGQQFTTEALRDENTTRARRLTDHEDGYDEEQPREKVGTSAEAATNVGFGQHARNASVEDDDVDSTAALAPYREAEEREDDEDRNRSGDGGRDGRSEKEAPRSILRKPTQKFPEHAERTREGVAPPKDAVKKGIPATARWTKINRELVNPQALEAAGERYEERQECVIVLRVLSLEEIQRLADRTREIRARYGSERKGHRHRDERARDHDGAEDADGDKRPR